MAGPIPIPLHDWSTTSDNDDPYAPPESGFTCLQGRIDAGTHQRLHSGGRVVTSRIVSVQGRIVTTRSGSVYELKAPNPEFLKWLEEKGYFYDEAQPLGLGEGSRKKDPQP